MKKRINWQAARIETSILVYDPIIKNLDYEESSYPIEMPHKGYNQVIHWKDGEVLVIETKDNNEELLHFYYEIYGSQFSVSMNDNRFFSDEDILPVHLRFKSRFEKNRTKALEQFGIISKNISYHLEENNKVYLRIGNLESGNFALINPKNYELYSIHSKIWNGVSEILTLKIIFKQYEKYRWQLYPKIAEYYIDNRLFKKIKITKIQTLTDLKLNELNKKALKFKKDKTTTLKNDYAL